MTPAHTKSSVPSSNALVMTQRRNVMRGVSREINRRESAGEQNLRVIFQRFLDVAPLPPRARAEQQSAGEVEQGNFFAGPSLGMTW